MRRHQVKINKQTKKPQNLANTNNKLGFREMAQSVKDHCICAVIDIIFSDDITDGGYAPITPAWEEDQRQADSGNYWIASLAEQMSFKFSERHLRKGHLTLTLGSMYRDIPMHHPCPYFSEQVHTTGT